jgi:5-methylcytosine-specific restriction protein B
LNALRTLIEEDEINWGDFKDDKMKEIRNKIQKLVKSNIPNEKNYVLIIDEINRGDISKIFGELITLIEKDKRIGEQNELIVQLPYSNDYFGVPPNLYILGTMNTADRSLALIDVALRRRFDFEEMQPELNDLEKNPDKYGSEDVKDSNLFKDSIIALKKLNTTLGQNPDIGKDKKIGHAFLCNLSKEAEILPIWRSKIMPLIEEYYYFDKNSLVILTNNIYTLENGWSTEDDKIKNLIEILKK